MKWYRKAAEQGYANAQCSLGVCYASGQGVEQDDKEAVKLYRKAAEQGNASAQSNLAFCYYKGDGVGQDFILRAGLEPALTVTGPRMAPIENRRAG